MFSLQRLHPEIASNVCQLLLWAPSGWLKPNVSKVPSSAEVCFSLIKIIKSFIKR